MTLKPITGPIVIACSATGGRHPIMTAILDTLENEVLHPLGYEPLRIGSSGGTLSALDAGDCHHEWMWLFVAIQFVGKGI